MGPKKKKTLYYSPPKPYLQNQPELAHSGIWPSCMVD